MLYLLARGTSQQHPILAKRCVVGELPPIMGHSGRSPIDFEAIWNASFAPDQYCRFRRANCYGSSLPSCCSSGLFYSARVETRTPSMRLSRYKKQHYGKHALFYTSIILFHQGHATDLRTYLPPDRTELAWFLHATGLVTMLRYLVEQHCIDGMIQILFDRRKRSFECICRKKEADW